MEANNSINQNLIFKHNLKFIPFPICIFFSPDQDAVYPLIWSYYGPTSGNPAAIRVDPRKIIITIYNGIPLFGYFDQQLSH